jgi:hypothetical protein
MENKCKFRVGEKVRLVSRHEVWAEWLDDMTVGNEYEVTITHDGQGDGDYKDGYIDVKGSIFTHLASQFELVKPNRISIILRRGADDRSIRKALEEMGVKWADGAPPTSKSYYEREDCRLLIIYTGSNLMMWSSAYGKYSTAREIRKREQRVERGGLILNTKPSVKQTITELKRYF